MGEEYRLGSGVYRLKKPDGSFSEAKSEFIERVIQQELVSLELAPSEAARIASLMKTQVLGKLYVTDPSDKVEHPIGKIKMAHVGVNIDKRHYFNFHGPSPTLGHRYDENYGSFEIEKMIDSIKGEIVLYEVVSTNDEMRPAEIGRYPINKR
jgi:hypothetical protein